MQLSNPSSNQRGLFGQLTRFVGPFMLGMLLQNLYGTADLFVVGNFATTADVSAVTVGSQVMTMITQTIIGFATGITVLVGLYYGEGNKRKLAQSVGAALPLFAVMTVLPSTRSPTWSQACLTSLELLYSKRLKADTQFAMLFYAALLAPTSRRGYQFCSIAPYYSAIIRL